MFLAELTAWMFKHLLSVDCSHLNEQLMLNYESAQMNIAIQMRSVEDMALYSPVHQLHSQISSMWKETWQSVTWIFWNHFKVSDSECRTIMRKMWVQCCHLDDSTLLALLSIMTYPQMPRLFLQIDCCAFTLDLSLACKCQYTIPSKMDIPSRTATYSLCRLCHICEITKDRWFSWPL